MTSEARLGFLFRHQQWHLLAVPLLVLVAGVLAAPALVDQGRVLGVREGTWFRLALLVPIAHQVFVWLAWRLELGWGSTSRTLGFPGYLAVFYLFLVARPFVLLCLGIADSGSLGWSRPVCLALGVLLTVPALYTLHSVVFHFGPIRAAGADHFDRRYRALPFVDEGAFALTSNAMYVLGFLGLWAIALFTRSQAALAAAAFQHAYIWVHWWCTERPDIRMIYGRTP